jgi:hypothetical protein
MSLIFGAFFRGLATFIGTWTSASVASIAVAASTTVSSGLIFFGRPLLRGAGLSGSTFCVAFSRDEWNC